MPDFKAQLTQINQELNDFINFVGNKLKNYKNLSIGEQISYPTIGFGFILLLTSMVMFII